MRLILAFFLSLSCVSQALAQPTAVTREGVVQGRVTASGGEFFANIPYAKPPVGELRWKAPRPPEKRSGTWDGSRINVKCAQLAAFFSGTTDDSQLGHSIGSEDCLYLNVWVPKAESAKRKPIFVWLHGGSNRQGFASDSLYDGEDLSGLTDSIVVTVNFRLGYFGAFYHEALHDSNAVDSSGNYVTLDAIRALEWVRANAAAFGGDPTQVTIGGESAGCVNVWGLLQSPLAKNLFARAYCSSGIPNAYPTSIAQDNAKDMIKRALVAKGRAQDDDQAGQVLEKMSSNDIKSFLYSLTTEEIATIQPNYFPIQHISEGTVLPVAGLGALTVGQFNAVPMWISDNGDEGSFFFLEAATNLTKWDYWRMMSGQTSPKPLFDILSSKDRFSEFESKRDRYTSGFHDLVDSISVAAQWYSPAIYRMRFEWQPAHEPWHSVLESSHGIDLPFLFHKSDLGPRQFFNFMNAELKDPASRALSERYLVYLKGFLHEGDPNAFAGKLPHWNAWTAALPFNMTLDRTTTAQHLHYFNPIVGTYELSRSIYELYDAAREH